MVEKNLEWVIEERMMNIIGPQIQQQNCSVVFDNYSLAH
jgi:hypothetical protein